VDQKIGVIGRLELPFLGSKVRGLACVFVIWKKSKNKFNIHTLFPNCKNASLTLL